MNRNWMPTEYMDEVVPASRVSPSEWIVKSVDGRFSLASGDIFADDDVPARPLVDGEVVHFHWVENCGTFSLTFHKSDDLGWTATLSGIEPDEPSDGYMNVAEVGEWETMMPSLSEFVQAYDDKCDGRKINVCFYVWAREYTPYVFRASGGVFEEQRS